MWALNVFGDDIYRFLYEYNLFSQPTTSCIGYKENIMKIFNYRILLQKEPEGGYTVTVPLLPGCVTYGKTIEEAKEMAKEAIELYLESLIAHNEEVPVEIFRFAQNDSEISP